jgi:trans-aconitate methyltransferase
MFSSPKVSLFLLNQVRKTHCSTIVDLGSGWGTVVFYLAIKNPTKTIIGYELSTIPFYTSKLISLLFNINNITLCKKNFLDVEFQKDTLYLCYLFPKGMELLEKKLEQSDFKPPLISSTFALPRTKWDKKKTIEDLFHTPIYLYKHMVQ